MSSRADKTLKQQKEKHHAILRELVQEPANKTCADCLAKGPRWSSWSLGVFVCIRCAGIHRNLGTHISKVKSVDLDSWSVEQIEHILKWGNKRASEYFECYLPKDFTRPQGNHAVETFIRNKYEKKLYIMKDGEPEPNPKSKLDRLKGNTSSVMEKETKNVSQTKRRERPEKKAEQKPASNETILSMSRDNPMPNGSSVSQNALSVSHQSHPKSSSMNDLLSLDTPASKAAVPVKSSASSNDLLSFGAFSSPVECPVQTPNDSLFGETKETPSSNTQELNDLSSQAPAKSTKESILSLYSSSAMSQQQPMYRVPGGVYMTPQQTMQQQMMMQQQQQQQPQNRMNMNYGYQANPMAANQMNQMNMQMRGMQLNPAQQQQQQPPFGKPRMQGFNPQQQQQQQFNMNQFNMASMANPSFNGQTAQPQYNMQYNSYSQPPVSNSQMNNFNMQSNMQPANMSWQANPMQTNNMMNGMQANGMMNNMNSGHTMNDQLWN